MNRKRKSEAEEDGRINNRKPKRIKMDYEEDDISALESSGTDHSIRHPETPMFMIEDTVDLVGSMPGDESGEVVGRVNMALISSPVNIVQGEFSMNILQSQELMDSVSPYNVTLTSFPCVPSSIDEIFEIEEEISLQELTEALHLNEIKNTIPNRDFIVQQGCKVTVSMREILINWLIDVAVEISLSSETLFLSINFIDRYLAIVPVERSYFQLIGITAIFIAAKYEESNPPLLIDLVDLCDGAYEREEVIKTEEVMLNALSFKLTIATTNVFARMFLKSVCADMQLAFATMYYTERTLQEYCFASMYPSVIASACICVGVVVLGRSVNLWIDGMRNCNFVPDKQAFMDCISKLIKILRKDCNFTTSHNDQELNAVKRKYSSDKCLCASLLPLPSGIERIFEDLEILNYLSPRL